MTSGRLKIEEYVPVVRINRGIKTDYDIETSGNLIASNLPLDVTSQGAIGDGITDNSEAFNAILSGGHVRIYIPAGDFLINSYVRLYEYTDIEMHPDAVIIIDNLTGELGFTNGEVGNTTFSSLYGGPGNISIRGGTMDCTPMMEDSRLCEPLAFMHAENILIENVTFKNNYQNHFIELNSTRHARVRNCRFENTDLSSAGSRESINIDYAFSTGYPHFGSYDGTVCDDIIIEDCVFIDGDVSVGSHSVPTGTDNHLNIKFINNYVENMTSAGVAPQYWEDSIIEGNKFKDCGVRGVKGWGIVGSNISNNTFIGECSSQAITIDDANGRSSSDNSVRNNIIRDTTGTGIALGGGNSNEAIGNIFFGIGGVAIDCATDSDRIRVFRNVIHGANQNNSSHSAILIQGTNVQLRDNKTDHGGYARQYVYPIQIQNGATGCSTSGEVLTAGSNGSPYRFPDSNVSNVVKVDGAYRVEIADDQIATIPVTVVNKQGVANIMGHSTASYSPRGTIAFRCNTGELVMESIAVVSAANVTYTTGVLTGTTGVDGNMTVSAIDSAILIENRSGAARVIRMQIDGQ